MPIIDNPPPKMPLRTDPNSNLPFILQKQQLLTKSNEASPAKEEKMFWSKLGKDGSNKKSSAKRNADLHVKILK